MQFLLFQPKTNALSREMSVPLRCIASIEKDLLLVAVILVLRWLVMKRRGLAKVSLLLWISIMWYLVAPHSKQPYFTTLGTFFHKSFTGAFSSNSCHDMKFERTLWERYRSILTTVSWITISALDECDKQGDSCPSGLQCLKQANGSHVCGCSAGYKVIGEGEWRSCQGIIAKDSYPIAIYVYLGQEKSERTGVRLGAQCHGKGHAPHFLHFSGAIDVISYL